MKTSAASVVLFVLGSACAYAQAQAPAGFALEESGLVLRYDLAGGQLREQSLLPAGVADALNPKGKAPDPATGVEVELQATGTNWDEHHGAKLIGGNPGTTLTYVERRTEQTKLGRHVVLVQKDAASGLMVESHYQFIDGVPVVRRWTKIVNTGHQPVGIEHASSAMIYGFANFGTSPIEEKLRVYYAHNSWKNEAQWRGVPPSELGWYDNGVFNMNAIAFGNVGSWSTMTYLPEFAVENRDIGVTWFGQIEHDGSWHWEMSNTPSRNSYLYVGGPDGLFSQAWKSLRPGESYETVPVAIGCVKGGFDAAMTALADYRRKACLPLTADAAKCPVIFNDYMLCLRGNPTAEKEYPLIDAAAAAGCEYYVIDAGWYADISQKWWDTVGVWREASSRWGKEGLAGVCDRVRAKGMIPGLWLEIEVAGINSALKDKPDSWFFQRHGQRVIDHGRYFLDFRNPEVLAYADSIINRVVKDYGLGYLKIDYNVDALQGTEVDADSPGQGMLEHQRAYLAWIDRVHARFPGLVIENCGSGGGRMDYAQLSHSQLQSISDQNDYHLYPAIVAGALAGVLPEQLLVWALPSAEGNADEASFNMVNTMLTRICLSGGLGELKDESQREVLEGIRVYKSQISLHLPGMTPFYPLGLADMADTRSPVAVGLRDHDRTFIAVWRLSGAQLVVLPLPATAHATLLYPKDLGIKVTTVPTGLEISFPRPYMAAVIQLTSMDSSSP